MIKFLIIAGGLAGLIEGGWVWGITMMLIVSILVMMAMTLLSFMRQIKYRDEFIACTEAAWSKNEQRVDDVNASTVHFYVHKSFYMSSNKGDMDMGYRYSVQERQRNREGSFDAI
jgi:hypothetical protein